VVSFPLAPKTRRVYRAKSAGGSGRYNYIARLPRERYLPGGRLAELAHAAEHLAQRLADSFHVPTWLDEIEGPHQEAPAACSRSSMADVTLDPKTAANS
jgi:hypothetical protein